MDWLELDAGDVTEYASRGVHMSQAARLTSVDEVRLHVAIIESDGLLGPHAGRLWQLFHVAAGAGWVAGEDGMKWPITAGQTVMWAPGEVHESGSEAGMTVVIAQASNPLPLGDKRDGCRPASSLGNGCEQLLE